jgi:hypothetical protein
MINQPEMTSMTRKTEVSRSDSLSAIRKLVTGVRKRTKTDTQVSPISEPMTVRSRQEAIALEAWLRAERRGFAAGDPVTDWLEAERAVDARLAAAHGHRTAA